MFWANRSFAHLSWASWANCSRSLICLERPEWFAHGHSFVLSNLSDLLTVAYLSWAIWTNRLQSLIWFEQNKRMSNEPMSEFPALKSAVKSKDILVNGFEGYTAALLHGCTVSRLFTQRIFGRLGAWLMFVWNLFACFYYFSLCHTNYLCTYDLYGPKRCDFD